MAAIILYHSTMKLYLARHGRTNYNDRGLCNSDPAVDVHLTDTGITQAETLANQLKEVRIDHIFVSELKRTRQTADIVNKFHDRPITVDRRLNDINMGFEGRHFTEYFKALGTADRWTTRLNGGESVEDIKIRAASFIDDLRTETYDSVLIVTSEWIVRAIMAVFVEGISNEEAWQPEIEQGSYRELEI